MDTVITGATGFIGTRLVRELLSAGHSAAALTRDVERAERRLPARCRRLAWDPAQGLEPGMLRGTDAVFHLAGAGIAEGRWTADRKRAIRDSRVETAAALVRALGALPAGERPRVLVSASAVGWYGDRGDTRLDEASAGGEGFLAEVCREWEGAVFAAREIGVRAVAVRVGMVLGRDGGALRMLLPLFRLGLGGRVGSGRQWLSWIHVDDLTRLFRFVAENPEASGPVNGVSPDPVTNATFTAELGRALGRPALVPVPAPLLRGLLGELSSLLLASQRVEPRVARQLGFTFLHPRLRAALDDLCGEPAHEILSEQRVDRPPSEVFRFFSAPANLEKITPPFLGIRVLGESTAEMKVGTSIDYSLRIHGVPVRWQSRIESWEPDRSFVDVQTRGPYALWRHAHEFEPDDGGTIVRDRVRYRLPLGALGEAVAGALVRRDLEAVFDYRTRRIRELLA